jgi:hypothetical protein
MLNELRLLLQPQQRDNYVLYVGELSAPGLYSLKTLFFSERPLLVSVGEWPLHVAVINL